MKLRASKATVLCGIGTLAAGTFVTRAYAQQATSAALAARAQTLPALTPNPAPQMAGSRRVTAQLCDYEGEAMLAENSFARAVVDIAVSSTDGAVYVIDGNNAVRRYRAAPGAACNLRLDPTFGTNGVSTEFGSPGLAGQLDGLTADTHGHVYVFSTMRGLWRLTGSHTDFHCADVRGRFTVTADGHTGFAVAFNRAQRIALTDAGCTVAPWTYQQPYTHTDVLNVVGNTVYVGGYNDNITHIVTRPYGFDGAPRGAEFGRDASFGTSPACYPHEIFTCAAGLCMQEGNCRNFFFLSAQNAMTGQIREMALFGLQYPWVSGISSQGRQGTYAAVNQEQGSQSRLYRGLIYRVTGM